MTKKIGTIAAIVTVGVLAAFTFARGGQQDPGAALKKWIGKPLPKFSMKTTDGKTITNATIKGKVVFFDFWATWCGPCKAASPSVDALAKKYKSKGLVVIGATYQDDSGNAKKYKAEHKYSYTFVDSADKLGQQFGIQGIPAFFFVDKKGIIREVITGYAPSVDKKFDSTIQSLLK